MTMQEADMIVINGKKWQLLSNPLDSYLEEKKINFKYPSSSLWRGYIAKWKLDNDKLFLVGMIAWFEEKEKKRNTFKDGKNIEFNSENPKASMASKNNVKFCIVKKNGLFKTLGIIDKKVFASWVTQKLRIPKGKQLSIGGGYCSIYEQDIILTFEEGKLTKEEIFQNGFISEDRSIFLRWIIIDSKHTKFAFEVNFNPMQMLLYVKESLEKVIKDEIFPEGNKFIDIALKVKSTKDNSISLNPDKVIPQDKILEFEEELKELLKPNIEKMNIPEIKRKWEMIIRYNFDANNIGIHCSTTFL